MRLRARTLLALAGAAALVMAVSEARAALVNWNVDSATSFIRLNIADQPLIFDGTTGTVRIRNNQNTSAWVDAGGRRAFLDGTIATQVGSGVSSIQFLQGQHNLNAVELGSYRPNPAAWDPAATNADNPNGSYTNTSGAPAALAGRIRATVTIVIPITVDVGLIAFRDVVGDLSSGNLALGGLGGSFGGSTTQFGLESSVLDVDGVSSLAGQLIEDMANVPIGGLLGENVLGGAVTYVSGSGANTLAQLLYNINVPIEIDLDGIILTASLTGQIRAFAIVPEPSTMVMAGFAAFGLVWAGRRRMGRRS